MHAPEKTGIQEEKQIPGTIVPLSASASIPPLCSIYKVGITGHSYKQCLFPPLFYALQHLPRLEHLEISYFNEVGIMPPELGTLAQLQSLTIEFCDKLRELPESLGNLLHLTNLCLDGLPKLRRLPESLSTVWARRRLALQVLNCRSLRSMPSSCGHTSPISKSWDDQRATSDSRSTLYPALDNARVVTDSRRVLRCLLECYNLGRYIIIFCVKCEEMERLRSMAIGGTTLATKLFRQFLMECHTGDDDPHEIFGPSTSWSPLNHRSGLPELHLGFPGQGPEFDLGVRCQDEGCRNPYVHGVTVLGVIDIDEEDNGDTEEDSEKDEDEEGDEEDTGDTEDSENDEVEEDDCSH